MSDNKKQMIERSTNALVFMAYLYLNGAGNSMELLQGIQNVTRNFQKAVVTIGNFDGVHLGHQTIIQQAVDKARSTGGVSIAYTFRPHPQVALRPASNVQLLSTYDEKIELLGKTGLDFMIEEPFSREFSTIAPEQFFNDVLLRKLSAQEIVVGYDFAFGKGRAGHLEALSNFCKSSGVGLTVVEAQRIAGEVVSSSRIREQLLTGDVEKASKLLGRLFSYRGVVIKGEQRGRQLGFPTANLKLENKLALPYGVYSTWARLGDRIFPSVTNVGVRPTFDSGRELPALVETHLLDTTIDLYGSTLEVQFVKRLRSEKKFSGMDELKAQITLDADQARKMLN
jgi:riboflavin kinase/FMN adenylyltransferase